MRSSKTTNTPFSRLSHTVSRAFALSLTGQDATGKGALQSRYQIFTPLLQRVYVGLLTTLKIPLISDVKHIPIAL